MVQWLAEPGVSPTKQIETIELFSESRTMRQDSTLAPGRLVSGSQVTEQANGAIEAMLREGELAATSCLRSRDERT